MSPPAVNTRETNSMTTTVRNQPLARNPWGLISTARIEAPSLKTRGMLHGGLIECAEEVVGESVLV